MIVANRVVMGVLCFLVALIDAEAKCAAFSVVLEGRLTPGAGQQEVLIRIHTNRDKEVIERRVLPSNDSFDSKIMIDTFVSAWPLGFHSCSRRPKIVEIILLKNGAPLQRVTLSIEQDFNWDANLAEWRTKLPVVLDAQKGANTSKFN